MRPKVGQRREARVRGVRDGWAAERGVECYERFRSGKYGQNIAVYNPMGAPAAYALSDKAAADKIPLVTLDYGRTEANRRVDIPLQFSSDAYVL